MSVTLSVYASSSASSPSSNENDSLLVTFLAFLRLALLRDARRCGGCLVSTTQPSPLVYSTTYGSSPEAELFRLRSVPSCSALAASSAACFLLRDRFASIDQHMAAMTIPSVMMHVQLPLIERHQARYFCSNPLLGKQLYTVDR